MEDGFLYIYYAKDENIKFSLTENFFSECNLHLRNPKSSDIIMFTEKGHEIILYDDIQKTIEAKSDLNINFWLDNSTNLYSQYMSRNHHYIERYFIDGFYPEELSLISDILWKYIYYLKSNKSLLGFVLDINGYSEEYYDWDSIFLSKDTILFPNQYLDGVILGIFSA